LRFFLGKKIIFILCIICLLFTPKVVLADRNEDNQNKLALEKLWNQDIKDILNPPVVSSTFGTTTQKLSPGNPYVITYDEMNKMGAISVADAIDRMVPGMNIFMNPNYNESISVRGFVTDTMSITSYMDNGLDIADHNSTGVWAS